MAKPKYLVLDKGFVVLDRVCDSDEDIVRRAQGDLKTRPRPVKTLLKYLLEREHPAPLGFPDLVFYIYAPQFVRDSLFQVRTSWRQEGNGVVETTDPAADQFGASVTAPEKGKIDFYMPEPGWLYYQPPTLPPGVGVQPLPEELAEPIRRRMWEEAAYLHENYHWYLSQGLSPDQAKLHLPSTRYVGWFWKQNLWHLLHWLRQVRDRLLGPEARAYIQAIEQAVREKFPLTYEAWDETMGGVRLTRSELQELREQLRGRRLNPALARKILEE